MITETIHYRTESVTRSFFLRMEKRNKKRFKCGIKILKR
jgi:hypothetical protein